MGFRTESNNGYLAKLEPYKMSKDCNVLGSDPAAPQKGADGGQNDASDDAAVALISTFGVFSALSLAFF